MDFSNRFEINSYPFELHSHSIVNPFMGFLCFNDWRMWFTSFSFCCCCWVYCCPLFNAIGFVSCRVCAFVLRIVLSIGNRYPFLSAPVMVSDERKDSLVRVDWNACVILVFWIWVTIYMDSKKISSFFVEMANALPLYLSRKATRIISLNPIMHEKSNLHCGRRKDRKKY